MKEVNTQSRNKTYYNAKGWKVKNFHVRLTYRDIVKETGKKTSRVFKMRKKKETQENGRSGRKTEKPECVFQKVLH